MIRLLRTHPNVGTRYEAARFEATLLRILLPETEMKMQPSRAIGRLDTPTVLPTGT